MFWLIITIVICTYIVVRVIKEQSPEGQNKKTAKAINFVDERVKYWRDLIMQKETEFVEGETLDKLRADLVKMEKKYSLLREKEKDLKSALGFITDLRDYAEAIFHLKMAWCIFETDMSHEAIDNYGKRIAEPEAKRKEIEEKFSRLLGHAKPQ